MAGHKLHRVRVLIVDDNNHMVNIIKTLLRGFGVKSFSDARSPDEAFEILGSKSIDLIITDFAMEPMDGNDFIRKIRANENGPNKFIPVLMLTAYSERRHVENARDAGVNEFCSKPVTATELYKKIRSIINAPRPFVRTSVYFGPDRRRRAPIGYDGEERRDSERDETVQTPPMRERETA